MKVPVKCTHCGDMEEVELSEKEIAELAEKAITNEELKENGLGDCPPITREQLAATSAK